MLLIVLFFVASGRRDGTVVRALASHQFVPGSSHGPSIICGLSLLLVLSSAPRGFSPVLRFSPLLRNQHFSNSNSILECTYISERVLWTTWCSVGKQITFTYIHRYPELVYIFNVIVPLLSTLQYGCMSYWITGGLDKLINESQSVLLIGLFFVASVSWAHFIFLIWLYCCCLPCSMAVCLSE